MPHKKGQPAGPRASGRSAVASPSSTDVRAEAGGVKRSVGAGPKRRPPARGQQTFALPAGGWSERRFWLILGLICLVALICRLAILVEYTARNPLAASPINDAQTYWDWAERIAQGKLIQDTPFFSAPLYPYLLGLIRAAGGSLRLIYLLQILADLATACLLAYAARGRFGARVGLLAAALFLLLEEPASFSLRILTCSLQLLLLAITYLLIFAQDAMTARRAGVSQAVTIPEGTLSDSGTAVSWIPAILAALLGSRWALCLSYAPAILLVVAVVPWLYWQSGRTA